MKIDLFSEGEYPFASDLSVVNNEINRMNECEWFCNVGVKLPGPIIQVTNWDEAYGN